MLVSRRQVDILYLLMDNTTNGWILSKNHIWALIKTLVLSTSLQKMQGTEEYIEKHHWTSDVVA